MLDQVTSWIGGHWEAECPRTRLSDDYKSTPGGYQVQLTITSNDRRGGETAVSGKPQEFLSQ
jgi:hypothetical protein